MDQVVHDRSKAVRRERDSDGDRQGDKAKHHGPGVACSELCLYSKGKRNPERFLEERSHN